MTKVINLVQEDIGRPVSHFKTNLDGENLAQHSQEVLDTLVTKETELRSTGGQWYLKRIQPYRAAHNVIDGVVITFIDITERKRLELDAEKAREFAETLWNGARSAWLVLDRDLTMCFCQRILLPEIQFDRSTSRAAFLLRAQ